MSDGEDRDDPLFEVALRVTDGESVLWDGDAAAAEPAAAAWIESMRLIADIASQHRDGQAAETPALFTWGPLRVLRKLGAGSFGEVYSAWDPALRREVALKLSADRDAAHALRPVRRLDEARSLARLRHPHVLTVYGVDVHDGRTGIWFDLLHGRTLEEDLRERGPMSAAEAAGVGMDLCSALAAVHGAGLVHGDLKTRNVMREGNAARRENAGRVVLMDFGSAHDTGPGAGATASPGTPLYAAPEVLQGEPPSVRSDLYALGVVLFRLVTGRYPVEARSIAELVEKLRRGDRASLHTLRPDLPSAFIALVERALQQDSKHRFPDAGAMERALLPILGKDVDGDRQREIWRARSRRVRRPVSVVVALAAAIAGLAVGVRWARLRVFRAPRSAAIASTARFEMRGGVRSGLGSCAVAFGEPGAPRIVVGACYEDRARGRAYVLRGAPDADAVPDLVFEGEAPGDRFANSAAAVGDVDADGHADLAIAAPGSEAGGKNAGRVYLYSGGPAFDARADLVLTGTRPLQVFGHALAGLGDVNGDGAGDLLVGAEGDDRRGSETGVAYLFFGGPALDAVPDLEFLPESPTAAFGNSVAGLGDVNGDGYPDFAAGAPLESADRRFAGRAYVFFGGPHLDAHADLVLEGHAERERFGWVARAGDLNADGHADLVVGAMGGQGLQERSGRAYVYFGGPDFDATADLVLLGTTTDSQFGIMLAGIGDVNRDGADDLLVSGPYADRLSPVAVYFGGRNMDAQRDLEFTADFGSEDVGLVCRSAGDFFQDGFPDLFLGSYYAGVTAPGDGRFVILDLARYAVARPRRGEIVAPGARATLGWLGAEPADVSISLDRGATWSRVARTAGGEPQNGLAIDVPSGDADSVLVRLVPSDPALPGRVAVAFPTRRPGDRP